MRQPPLLNRPFRFTVLPLAMLLLASVAAFGQSDTGRIAGILTDQNGAVVPGATVTAKNNRTAEARSANSTDDGAYLITNLKPSTYTVTVTAPNLSATATN